MSASVTVTELQVLCSQPEVRGPAWQPLSAANIQSVGQASHQPLHL
eukprot:COSAG02_NODE_39174_length_420_cov_0.806854_2_plen_45_part_01